MIQYINGKLVGGVVPVQMSYPVRSAYLRWLRFNPSNKRGLVIKAGTEILKADGTVKVFNADTEVDLSAYVTEGGKDYFVYLNNSNMIYASTDSTAASGSVKIGRFHTLCVAVGTATMIAPSSGLAAGAIYLVKPYRQDIDPDFYSLYAKSITAVTSQSYYDVATMAHPLSGYTAGDILPESVWCVGFEPDTLFEDAMVYDKAMDIAVDIYLQSGKGTNTKSVYGATHTVSRQQWNHEADMLAVGKVLLNDAEFTSIALGSNERTNITGSSDKGTVGGHVDTANRRMISAIGVEEACGYLWQWTRDFTNTTTANAWANNDGHGSFGQQYHDDHSVLAGGFWGDGASCGSRCRYSYIGRSVVVAHLGGRGSSRVKS